SDEELARLKQNLTLCMIELCGVISKL
ncbi:MAG: hypothetical protein UX68_C0030G0001, partial [Parcubacteria group bacterium GW2011_GWA2_46_9]